MNEGPQDGRVSAIVVAAGRSERMQGVNKLFAQLMGKPLIVWTLTAFKRCAVVDDTVVVTGADVVEDLRALVDEWRLTESVRTVVVGGSTRQASVRIGLEATEQARLVVIHDGARPLVTPELIERTVAAARETGAAIPAVPARDTVKRVEGDPLRVQTTMPRDQMWLAQTPQCFDRKLLLEAHLMAETVATDDAALVEALGRPVAIAQGESWNMKVTTREDLVLAEALMRARLALSD